MKHHFQAKDIQKTLNLPKYRYEYLSSKIGIKPDINEVEGTGYAHLYSFRNLLQFAFVHRANGLGLSPKAIREMISKIEKYNYGLDIDIYDPKEPVEFKLYYINIENYKRFIPVPGIREGFVSDQEGEDFFVSLINFQESIQDSKNSTNIFKDVQKKLSYDKIEELLDNSDGYVVINIGNIKKRVMERINK